MKESEFDLYTHCGKCKRPLKDHPWENIPELGSVLRKFGENCPYPEVPFDG